MPRSDRQTSPVRAAGVLLCTGDGNTPKHFLLMRHADRWDLPKGHCDGDETFLQAALRETTEETGIPESDYRIDDSFYFDLHYEVRKKRYGKSPVQKQVRYFLAWTDRRHDVTLTEHEDYHWQRWHPPHDIQTQTINPLLAAVEKHLQG